MSEEIANEIAQERLIEQLRGETELLRYHLEDLQESVAFWPSWAANDNAGMPEHRDGSLLGLPSMTAHSRVYDRQDGRFLPYYDTEWDLKLLRQTSRTLAAFTETAIGGVETICSYVIKTGFTFQVQAKKGVTGVDSIVNRLQKVIDRFLLENKFYNGLDREIHNDCRRDGEKIIALKPQTGYVARCLVIEPDELTEPARGHEISQYIGVDPAIAHWEYGILTIDNDELGCHDTENSVAYHVVHDDAGYNWDALPADRVVHFKRNTSRRAKRGVSDFIAMHNTMDSESQLVNSISHTMRIMANIAFVKERPEGRSGGSIPTGADGVSMPVRRSDGGSRTVDRYRYHPGTVPDLANGLKYVPGPLANMKNDAVEQTLSMLIKRIAMYWTIPYYMLTGDTETALYSSVLAIGSPFVNRRQMDQVELGEQFVELIEKALKIAYDTGQISDMAPSFQRLLQMVEITYTAPDVALTDDFQRAQRQQLEIAAGTLSRETAIEEAGREVEVELPRINRDAAARPTLPTAGPGLFDAAFEESLHNPCQAARRIQEAWGAYP